MNGQDGSIVIYIENYDQAKLGKKLIFLGRIRLPIPCEAFTGSCRFSKNLTASSKALSCELR